MPYKYDNQKLKKYYIDYNSLYNELVHNPAFTAYDKYIEQQLNNLLKLEAKPIVHPLKFNDKFYCHKFSIGLSELFITFNITYIERFITDIKHLMHTLDIRNFGIKNSSIIYTE